MLLDFHLPTQKWVYFPGKKLSSFQSILTWTVLSYQTELKGTKAGHDYVVVLAIPSSTLNLVVRRKLTSWFKVEDHSLINS